MKLKIIGDQNKLAQTVIISSVSSSEPAEFYNPPFLSPNRLLTIP